MMFNSLFAVAVFAVSMAIGISHDKAERERSQRQHERYMAWAQSGRGRVFGESEIVPMGKWGVFFVSIFWAVVAGLTVAALGGG